MKRKLLICSSLITLLLSVFSVPIYAETTTNDDAGSTPISSSIQLDSYFYQNYDLLPYIESDGSQYINTGVSGSSDINMTIKFSDIQVDTSTGANYLFGSYVDNIYGAYISRINNSLNIYIVTSGQASGINIDPYVINEVSISGNDGYLNGNLIFHRESDYSMNGSSYIFARNQNGNPNNFSSFKLYSFKIYDQSLNDGEGEYIRYYYPAKAKASGTIGLYDSVSKTFITTGSSSQFINPTDSYVQSFQITSFLTASLTWIGQIFDAIIQMPIIIVFMAIGLAGAMFRWGRRIVHF